MLLNPRRYGDGAKDLWTTLNCVQENIIRGGQRDRSRRRPDGSQMPKSRTIKGIAAFLRPHGGTFYVLNSPIQEIEATARGFPNATAGEPSPNVRFDPRKHKKALTASTK